MEEFAASVNEYLEFRRYKILDGKGSISRADAEKKAVEEYDLYKKTQTYLSDFDREVRRMESEREGRSIPRRPTP